MKNARGDFWIKDRTSSQCDKNFLEKLPKFGKTLAKLGKTALENVAKRSRNHPNRDILPNVITLLAFETLFLDMEVS